MRKNAATWRFLTAFVFVLYLGTPYISILPVSSIAPFSPSAPSQNYGSTSLPPGTVTDILPSPKLVQSQDFDYGIRTRMVSTPSGCSGTQGCLTWITPQGNLTFSEQYPFVMSYAYFGAKNNTAVSLAAFDVTEGNHGILRPGVSTVTTTSTTYDVNTTEFSGGPNTIKGYLDVKYDFGSTPFKATATYRSATSSTFNIRWLVAGYGYVADPTANATRQISSLPTDTNATIGLRSAVSLTDTPTGRWQHTLIDVRDAGNATFVYGHLRFFLGSGNAKHYDSVAAVFPTNASRIDPTLVQMSANTCSYVCSGGRTTVSFPSGVTANDMLVVTVVTDNSNILSVSDSLGTKIGQAVSASIPSCGNGLSCQADIYWGLFPSSNPDTVTVSDGASDRALRVQVWEFSGVGAIGNTVSCVPACGSVSYPADSVLIATAMDAYGAGPGFTWYQYFASSVAGSELEIAPSQGSTSFPFSTAIDHVEAGAVLVGVVPQSATPPWGEPGLSPYESYVNNAVVYVSMGNGLVSVEQPTFYLPGRGLSVAPALFYEEPGAFHGSGSSPNQYDNFTATDLGYGWSLNIPWLGAYNVHLADGQRYPYSWNGGTDMQVHGPVDFEVTSTGADGVCPCRLLLPSGLTYYFDQYKQLIAETDTNNNVVQFNYGTNGLLGTMVDSVGRVTSFVYSGTRLLAIVAPGSRVWILGYSDNDLVSIQNPVGDVERFSYAPSNPWLLTSVTYAAGGTVNLVYGSEPVFGGTSYVVTLRYTQNSPTSITQSDSISYTFDNGVLSWANMTEADGTGTIQGYVKDHYSLSTNVTRSYSQDSTGTTTRIIEQDFQGNRLASTEVERGTGAVLARSAFSYDDWGNVIHTKDNVGHETWFSYDGASSHNSFTNPNCSTSGFYDNPAIAGVHSLLVGTCTYQDVAQTVQQETFNEYNGNAELTEQKISHNGGYIYTDYTYDNYGNVLSVRDANNNYVYFSYSSVYGSAYLTKKSLVAGGQNITTYHSYDFNTGFMTSTTDPRGYTTSTTYDAIGRTLTVTYPAVDGISGVESYSYHDPIGLATITDPRGNQTNEYLDGLGRVIAVQRMNGSATYTTTYYTYNWLDKVASVQDARGYPFSFAYDQAGRPTRETFPDGTIVTASYDDTNNVVTVRDQDGRQALHTYDWNGRLVSVTQYSTSIQPYTTTYGYDGVGNLVSVVNNIVQTTSYGYDDLNRLGKATTPDGNFKLYAYDNVGNVVTKTTPNGATIGYSYDQASRLVATNYPDGTFSHLSYDQDGNVIAVASTLSGYTTDAYSYDPMNRLRSSTVSVSGADYTTTYSYDRAGNLVEIQYPDGLILPMTYDAVNRLKSVGRYASFAYNQDDGITAITFGDGEVQSYSYDSRDRPTNIDDVSGNRKLLSLSYGYDGASNAISVNNDRFAYDNMSRVLSAKEPGGATTYTYDGAGNILGSAAGSVTTVYRGCGYYPNTTSGTVVHCGTDKDGNIVSKTGGWAYAYDYEDQMTSVKSSGTTVQSNVYDGMGNRVEKTETDTTVFTYLGVDLLFEKGITTGATTDHIYGDGIQLAKVAGGMVYYYHEDGVGSNRLVTYVDSKGKVVALFSSDYTPYGTNFHVKGSESFQYTDRMLDAATGLYYFNTRFYDPSTMRFMTKDPVAGDTATPASLNLHAYAGGNPLSNVDPTGTVFLTQAVNPWQWFFSLENQIRGYLGLPPCAAACQEVQMDRYTLIAPFIGMYTGGEGDVAEFLQQRITSLTADQFDALVRSEPIARYRTNFVQARLAVELGGSMRAVRTETPLGYRLYDIKAPGLLGELKFGRDILNPGELEKDVAMLKLGRNVHYYLVDNPVGNQMTPRASINKLKALGIPYTHFTWDEFLRWIEIPD